MLLNCAFLQTAFHSTLHSGGFGPVADDGYGVSYMVVS